MREQLSEMERQRKTLDIVSQELQQVLSSFLEFAIDRTFCEIN
jgi:hypothetical protein